MRRKALIALALVATAATTAELVVVKRDGVRLMKAPRFWGEPCGSSILSSAKAQLVEQKGSWARIAEPGGGKCWMHASAWTDRTPGELVGDQSKASQRDVELAGRGFTEAEEKNYRKDSGADVGKAYDLLGPPKQEKPPPHPSFAELRQFVHEGKLAGGDK
jgi:hypothetical protein